MNKPTFEEVMKLTRTVSGCAALEEAEALGLYNACAQVTESGLVVEVGCQLGRSSSLIRQMALAIGFAPSTSIRTRSSRSIWSAGFG